MPDVLILTQNDWANTGWRFFKCLQHLGLDVMGLKGEYHRMGYPEQLPVHPALVHHPPGAIPIMAPALAELVHKSKAIHFIGSTLVETTVNLKDKPVVMQHGGTTYRNYHDQLNEIYNEIVDFTIIQCPDLLGLGAKNEHLIYYPVDAEFIKPDFTTHSPLVIGHFPSNPGTKGTPTILSVIEELEKSSLKDKFKYIGTRQRIWDDDYIRHHEVLWTENLKRLKGCDIIIESCQPEINGKKFGEWGNSALEAGASGCIVVTNHLEGEIYKKEYDSLPFIFVANDAETLYAHLTAILSDSEKTIKAWKEKTYEWVKTYHSIPATAERLWAKIYSKIFS